MTGFEQATTATLHTIRSNLRCGLDKVAASLKDGTFRTVGPKGEAPPAESGQTTRALLEQVDAILADRAEAVRNPPRAFLEAVRHGLYWLTMEGVWMHNAERTVPAADQELLSVWAVCRLGGTVHLNDAGWALLDAAGGER